MPSTYEPIATQTLGSTAASVTFSSIPSTYTDLVVVASGTFTTGDDNLCMQFNGSTGANYSVTNIVGDGSTAGSFRTNNTTNCGRDVLGTTQGVVTYNINNYSNTTTYKTVIGRSGPASYGARASISMWRNTAAIDQIVIFSLSYTFNVGTVISIYGIKAA
jgi:hypothetical protein